MTSNRHLTDTISSLIVGRRGRVSFLLELQHCKDITGTLICNKKYTLFALKNAFLNFDFDRLLI